MNTTIEGNAKETARHGWKPTRIFSGLLLLTPHSAWFSPQPASCPTCSACSPPSSCIPHSSSCIPRPSSRIPHSSSLILHPSSCTAPWRRHLEPVWLCGMPARLCGVPAQPRLRPGSRPQVTSVWKEKRVFTKKT